ncbi:MAG TPA: HlyD family efflux transporter periplasmic adaptor subunit [Terriglobales bacterium]|nr:HlyD family efflux transporter periplasmic adaptor subunit [Terriglobales bacterium]
MNIVQALDVALPELPERVIRRDTPKLDTRVITKEHIEDGRPIVLAKLPGTSAVLRFIPEQWKLVQLFDGNRSYAEISELSAEATGVSFSENDVREVASFLYDETDFICKTPLEKNIILKQELRGQRRKKRKRFRITDFTDITVKEWPNADRYLSWLYPRVKFLYAPRVVLFTLFLFAVMLWMWADKLGEIWTDSFEFFNFTTKSGNDLIEFWFLFAALAFFHETGHGLTCKHFGANVEKMGFTLMYFAPSFFCDSSQAWIYGGKWVRIAVAIAGIWIDLILCAFATVIWWGTATGMTAHDLAYKAMMVTGIGVSLLNLNPLIELDGYLIFCELVHETGLKEKSTAYISSYVRKNVFGLPVEVEFVPRRRRAFYIIYAILSSLYGYVLLSFLMLFTFHVAESYSPEWAFVPALAAGYWVFKSRIHTLVTFMKIVYLDKRERVKAWLSAPRIAALSVAAVLLIFLPLWPDTVQGGFVLEPTHKAFIRAEIPGTVIRVLAGEGQMVVAGQPLVELSNLGLQSAAAQADADLHVASAEANQALLSYRDFGAAEYKREETSERNHDLATQVALLRIDSPIAGTVATPRMQDLLGTHLDAGAQIAEVADLSTMIARVYIPEFGMREVRLGARVRLQLESHALPFTATLLSVAPASTTAAASLLTKEQLKGINPPRFYVGSVPVRNTGELREGMTGIAKIFVTRRSLAGLTGIFTRDLIGRRLW